MMYQCCTACSHHATALPPTLNSRDRIGGDDPFGNPMVTEEGCPPWPMLTPPITCARLARGCAHRALAMHALESTMCCWSLAPTPGLLWQMHTALESTLCPHTRADVDHELNSSVANAPKKRRQSFVQMEEADLTGRKASHSDRTYP